MELASGLKQTELGPLPADWDVLQIKDLKPFVTSGSRGWAAYYAERGAAFIRISNLSRGCIYPDLDDLRFVNVPAGNSEAERTQLKDGDVLISITADIGIIGYVTAEVPKPAYINQHIALLRFDSETTCPRYVAYFLASERPQKLFRFLTDSGAKAGMNLTTVQQVRLAVPSEKREQEAIAQALSDADALIASLERLLAKKRDIKQGVMQELLTGKRRLPGFNGDWQEKPLGHLFTFSGGYTASREQLSTEGHCYLHYGDIHKSAKSFIDVSVEFADIPKLDIPLNLVRSSALLGDGDVVFVDASEDDEGTSKHVVVVNKGKIPFISGLHTIVAKAKTDELTHEYRRYCFQTRAVRDQFLFYAVGTKVSGISKGNVGKIMILVPPKREQTAIAAVLSDIDAELETIQVKLAKARFLKQGMAQELLTGRIRLK